MSFLDIALAVGTPLGVSVALYVTVRFRARRRTNKGFPQRKRS